MKCKWIIRPGTYNTFWAYTSCKPGYNYLSKINSTKDIEPAYNGRLCPICNKPIECDVELLKDEIVI